jgi:hypothetical protein
MFSLVLHQLLEPLGCRQLVRSNLGLLLICLLWANRGDAAPQRAEALVLVNSTSSRHLDFRNLIQPYLDHFGLPYSVTDLKTNDVGTNLDQFALIIIGHAQLDTNHVYLSAAEQSNIVQAVTAGTGLVNFDPALSGTGVLTNYQYVQDIFGFTYPGGDTGNFIYETTFIATEPGAQFHYIVAGRPLTNNILAFRSAITMLKFNPPADVKVLARANEIGQFGQPLLAVKNFGAGRAVQWGSYDWMKTSVRGPLSGMDGLVWRSLIWAARKPFVLRGMPNLVSLRVDDTVGPHWWLKTANETGFKPWLGPFIASMTASNVAELRAFATNGNCTVSVHAFTPGDFVFWNHSANTNWSDVEISNRMYHARQWHVTNGIPLSKVIVPHTTEAGANAFPWFKQWGAEFFTFVNQPGNSRFSPWLVAGPFRKHVPTEPAVDLRPLCYADFLNIPGHPELAGEFFNATTIIKDDSPCGEWCPDNDVAATVARGVRQLKRSFDSLAQGVLWTHEAFISYNGIGPVYTPSITTNNWRTILQSITNQLASYQPQSVTLDYACQYVRATRTAGIAAATFHPELGQISLMVTGRADLAITTQVYLEANNAITNLSVTVPPFTNNVTVSAQITAPPVLPAVLRGGTQSNGFKLSFSATPGREHHVEYRPEANAGPWLPLTNFTVADTNATIVDPATQPQRFYRVRVPTN